MAALVNIGPIRDESGAVLGALNVFQDVTEQEQHEEELRQKEGQLKALVSALPAAVYTTDRDGYITLFNEAAAGLWGRRPELGKEMWCGSYRIFRPDGSDMPLDQCPMAVALKEAAASAAKRSSSRCRTAVAAS